MSTEFSYLLESTQSRRVKGQLVHLGEVIMRRRRDWCGGIVLSIYSVLAAGGLFFLFAESVQAGGPQCCNPAHAATPTAPAGAGTSCVSHWYGCTNDGGVCSSNQIYQDAVKGECQEGAGTCKDKAAMATIACYPGTWSCNGTGCSCVYRLIIFSNPNNNTVDNCTGSGC
jgi:hypothetical protein